MELLGGQLVADPLGETNELHQTKDTCESQPNVRKQSYLKDIPSEDMCSLLLMGRKPTNGICMLANVPRAYQVV